MDTNDSSRRSSTTANRRVQHALIKRVFLHWCIFVISVTLVSAFVKSRQPTFATQSWSEFLNLFAYETVPFLVVVVAFLPAFILDSHRISHRFAGPMVRFRRGMADVVNGRKVPSLNFRPGDFWHDIAVHFNQINKRFKPQFFKEGSQDEVGHVEDQELVGTKL